MNAELLLKVKQAVLEHPSQFTMERWFADYDSTGMRAIGCGTAACIAGWTIAINSAQKECVPINLRKAWCNTYSEETTSSDAAELLGLHRSIVNELFLITWWPMEFSRKWHEAHTAQEKAQVAAARIDDFIKTYGDTDT